MLRCSSLFAKQTSKLVKKDVNKLFNRTIATNQNDRTSAQAEPKQDPNLIEITIDDKKIQVEKGITILEAAALAGIEIPRFCYHDRLSIAGNCRMCLVEVEKSVKPVASCAMPVIMPGMTVKTNSDFAKKAREGVMEFLLKNHPLDCPICDQGEFRKRFIKRVLKIIIKIFKNKIGGECDLQDQSMAFGSDKSRLQVHLDPKRSVEDKNIGTLVKTIMTRCIHCTRCVRFMSEVAGSEDFGTTGRGEDMQIGTYLENTILLSELSGNIVDLCPVGALTSKPYAFTARPWELRKIDSVDVLDAVGSNIVVCSRAGDLLRILPRLNEDLNEEWLADKSRHAPIDGLKNQRLTVPLLRPSRESALQGCDWEDALIIISNSISNISERPNHLKAIVGSMTDAETMVAIKDLFNSLGSEELYYHVDATLDPTCLPDNIDFRANYLFNTTIAGLEDGVDFILLIGTNPRFEAPMLNSRIRKMWKSNALSDIASVGPEGLDLLYDYEWLGDSTSSLNEILKDKSSVCNKLKNAKKPIIILGQQILKSDKQSNVYQLAQQISKKYNAEFNVLHANASAVAAMDLGFKPSTKLKISENEGQNLLWLFGVDDDKLEIPKNYFTIYQGHNGDECVNKLADVVLPGSAYTEKQAVYCNLEGRVQQTLKAISPPVMGREDWKIIRACSELVNRTLPYDNLLQIRERMSQLSPALAKPTSTSLEQAIEPVHLDNNNKFSTNSVRLDTKLKQLIDYYQTDPISKSSSTMAKCVISIQKEIEKRKSKEQASSS